MSMTAALLFIACLNLVNLLLARCSARRHEFAVRLAIGAGRGRLARQLLTESLLLALGGGALGLALAYAGSIGLRHLVAGGEASQWLEVPPNGTVLLFHLATAVLAGAVVGLLPARLLGRQGVLAMLKDSSGAPVNGRKLLVSAQVALCVVVLASAGLFLRTVHALRSTSLGFRANISW
jgi:ABC-type lipoprotein release transport system permease subunit